MKKIKIYSGFFLSDGRHITWEFNPGKCDLPKGVAEAESVDVVVVGSYKDEEVQALQVEVVLPGGKVLTHQPGGTPLHITIATNGVPPVESGIRIKKFGATPIKPYTIKAKAGFFKAPPRA